MPKTTDAVSPACAKLEVQIRCTGPWYDVGGEMNAVSNTKETRETGSTAVFNDLRHVTAGGKSPPLTVTFSGVYTEIVSEAFTLIMDLWEDEGVSFCDKTLCVRWTPKGGSVGDYRFYMTENPQLVGFMYPPMDAGSAVPIPMEFDVFGYISSESIDS
jgi:hypothetical protein